MLTVIRQLFKDQSDLGLCRYVDLFVPVLEIFVRFADEAQDFANNTMLYHNFIPIPPRTAKTLWSFGRSECKRGKFLIAKEPTFLYQTRQCRPLKKGPPRERERERERESPLPPSLDTCIFRLSTGVLHVYGWSLWTVQQ